MREVRLSESEQAVLEAYRNVAAQHGSRKNLTLTKYELAHMTGLTASRCDTGRTGLMAKGLIRRQGFTRPMRIELL